MITSEPSGFGEAGRSPVESGPGDGAVSRPSLVALVPVLARPHLVAPLIESFHAATPGARLLFIATPGDRGELRELRRCDAEHVVAPFGRNERSQYPRKINHGVSVTDEEWILLGADDLRFHLGWFEAALQVHAGTGCRVIGTNDLGNATVMRGDHSTHPLVHRSYVELGCVDAPGELLRTVYDHNSCDVELVETAKARGEFAFAGDAHVEHLHRLWRKAPMDATYRKGLRFAGRDKRLFLSRRRLWADGL